MILKLAETAQSSWYSLPLALDANASLIDIDQVGTNQEHKIQPLPNTIPRGLSFRDVVPQRGQPRQPSTLSEAPRRWGPKSAVSPGGVCVGTVSTVGCDGGLPDRARTDQIRATVIIADIIGRSRPGLY